LAPEDALLVDCAGEDDEGEEGDPPDDPPTEGLEDEPPPPLMLGAVGALGVGGRGEVEGGGSDVGTLC